MALVSPVRSGVVHSSVMMTHDDHKKHVDAHRELSLFPDAGTLFGDYGKSATQNAYKTSMAVQSTVQNIGNGSQNQNRIIARRSIDGVTSYSSTSMQQPSTIQQASANITRQQILTPQGITVPVTPATPARFSSSSPNPTTSYESSQLQRPQGLTPAQLPAPQGFNNLPQPNIQQAQLQTQMPPPPAGMMQSQPAPQGFNNLPQPNIQQVQLQTQMPPPPAGMMQSQGFQGLPGLGSQMVQSPVPIRYGTSPQTTMSQPTSYSMSQQPSGQVTQPIMNQPSMLSNSQPNGMPTMMNSCPQPTGRVVSSRVISTQKIPQGNYESSGIGSYHQLASDQGEPSFHRTSVFAASGVPFDMPTYANQNSWERRVIKGRP